MQALGARQVDVVAADLPGQQDLAAVDLRELVGELGDLGRGVAAGSAGVALSRWEFAETRSGEANGPWVGAAFVFLATTARRPPLGVRVSIGERVTGRAKALPRPPLVRSTGSQPRQEEADLRGRPNAREGKARWLDTRPFR